MTDKRGANVKYQKSNDLINILHAMLDFESDIENVQGKYLLIKL